MKLQTEEFKRALQTVKPAVAKLGHIEQTDCYIFSDGYIIGYNDEICISHPVIGLEATGAVDATTLHNYVGKLKRLEMELKTTPKEMQIKCGKSRAGLPLASEIVAPIDQITPAKEWKPLPENFNDFLHMASGAAARDLSMPKLTCVDVSKEGTITGSDNLRILQCDVGKLKFPGFLIPATSAKTAAAMKPTEISVTKQWIHMRNSDRTVVSCRTYADTYEDVSEYMTLEGQQFTFPRTYYEVLDRARVFSQAEIAQDEEVTVTVADNRIKITARGDHGWFSEEINHEYGDEPFSFTIIPYLLQDILKRTDTCTVNEHGLLFQGEGWKYVSALINME